MRQAIIAVYSIAVLTAFAVLPDAASHAGAAHGVQAPREVPASCSCAECGMTVKPDSLFASQIILRDGKTLWFCDLGDMLLHYDGLKDKSPVAAVYVRDYQGHGWTDGRKAFYLTGSSVRTPMRYGILGFADRKAAEAFKAKSGGKKVVSFDEAIAADIYEE